MDSHWKFSRSTAENIISEHEGALLRYAGLILGTGALAQDVVETAFIRVLHDRNKVLACTHEEISAELYKTVHGVALELAGRRQDGGARSEAMEAIRSLEPLEQQVIILKLLAGMSTGKISGIVGLSEERVARLLYKSVMNVTGKLKKAGLL